LARGVVEGFCSGMHRSPHKGFSVEFKEHRSYVKGDELRNIDWKVFGKTDRLYIREYEEETNLRCTMLADCSGSMKYKGSRSELSKHEYATRLAASLAYLLLGQQDSIGLVTFDTEVRSHIPPRSRPGHLKPLLQTLVSADPGGETALAPVLHSIVSRLQRRGLVVILSDCFGDVEEVLRALAHFRHSHHELIVFQILDPDEIDFPFDGRTQFENLEVAGHHRLVEARQLRQAYLDRLAEVQQRLREGCRRYRADFQTVSTDQPYGDALAQFLVLRRRLG
ncbi:MAG: DUF58 domain-containing protein, partial [Planctomycetota bacterium]